MSTAPSENLKSTFESDFLQQNLYATAKLICNNFLKKVFVIHRSNKFHSISVKSYKNLNAFHKNLNRDGVRLKTLSGVKNINTL